jgi:hypothetical protein
MSPETVAAILAGASTSSIVTVTWSAYGTGGRMVHIHRSPTASASASNRRSQGHQSWKASRRAIAAHTASRGCSTWWVRSERISTEPGWQRHAGVMRPRSSRSVSERSTQVGACPV